jgi:hypothetical protein
MNRLIWLQRLLVWYFGVAPHLHLHSKKKFAARVNVANDMLLSCFMVDRQQQGFLQSNLQLIGILRMAVELGQINIFYQVSVLSQYQANPRAVWAIWRCWCTISFCTWRWTLTEVPEEDSHVIKWHRILMTLCSMTMLIGQAFMVMSKRSFHQRCQSRGPIR